MQDIKIMHHVKPENDRVMEFHISKKSRDKYNFDKNIFSITGNVIIPNIYGARVLADKMNKVDSMGIKPSDLFAMGLIDEILHFVIAQHRKSKKLHIFGSIINGLKESIGPDELNKLLLKFIKEFPGSTIINGKEKPKEYLLGFNENGISNRELVLEEMLLLHLANINPAFSTFKVLFDEKNLKAGTKYKDALITFKNTLSNIKAMDFGTGQSGQSLYDLLREPALKHPNSLVDQLNFIMEHWGVILSDFNLRLLKALDSIKEENKACFWGPAPTHTQTYKSIEDEIENFTMDKHWMPNVMLLAKSTMVWLDQLSKKYKRKIDTLCKIPDEELDIIAERGFNGLWLIGLWNRSEASRKIKQRCGNPEAVSSAYSLYNYDINLGLGGWDGIDKLRKRCAKRGIRLASDMVPNHTGIDSEWIRSKPDYFIQNSYPPFPTYTFNSENLSDDPNIGIYLEDHYYSREDAAVVFKRVDHNSGDTRYIYHGNDGTMMPWNDTAQINFLNPEAREAVIQDIIHVAKNFPIIRFDAAMTLAKRHIQRLWFPQPGHGGDIASRSDHAMSQEDFDKAIPMEFWREVVDRIAVEAPDTLLLAEAFWMLEGYFVRTLGMHRVYNSAFMNMLKNEENQKYRESIINTINFDPDILKRYVNFMNNPDEDTAIEQFGSGDKYFGVCTLMVTLPGLPMFGHGQIEGYKEKYGMEYSKAYWDEQVDEGLVEGHNHLIFPLMRKRKIFSEVENFNIYPFMTGGHVNHNVFAYTNNFEGERSLILYNNSYYQTDGWVKYSENKLKKNTESRYTSSTTLSESFGLHPNNEYFCIFTNQKDNLTYIRSSKQLAEEGMFFSLSGYETQVFLNIYEVKDASNGYYAKLHHELKGSGVRDINLEVRKLELGELYTMSEKFFNQKDISKEDLKSYLKVIGCEKIYKNLYRKLESLGRLEFFAELIIKVSENLKVEIFDEWLFQSFFKNSRELDIIIFLIRHKDLSFKELLKEPKIENLIGVHEFNKTLWFDKESYLEVIDIVIKIRGEKLIKEKTALKYMNQSEFKYKELLTLV